MNEDLTDERLVEELGKQLRRLLEDDDHRPLDREASQSPPS